MDEEKINRLIDAILVMQEQEDTITPALRSQLAETESAIGNILKAIEQGIFTPLKTPLQSELLGDGLTVVFFLFPLYFQCFHALLGAKHLRRENGNRIKSDRKT